ncbi:MAG: bifunctional hydroxymethylpyrimidine kinase/phosphomethylpyrimidine kinase [Verrucomicrobiota bacterium]|jgi:hydroxymethylpyrimidine/phosphomethylpyrimidine kinase
MKLPITLTIAGSDSGGGAGIQTDLKTFAALGVHGTSVVTCITAQNPRRVTAVEACSTKIIRAQLDALFAELPPTALKTGMLHSAEIIRTVASFLDNSKLKTKNLKLILDPVMVATSGAILLKPAALRALTEKLFPLAALITPNLDETAVLLGRRPASAEEMRDAARALWLRYGCAVLVKGGHLRDGREALDIFFDGETELLLTAPFIRGLHLHGTGCTYSAAITAHLALGGNLPDAVVAAKEFITRAIASSARVGKHTVLVPH